MSDRIKYYVFSPNENLGQRSLNPNYCARQVAEGGRSVGFNQCGRKIVKWIDGYGFCKQHYEEVSLALGLDNTDVTIKFFAEFSYGKPKLAVAELSNETEHTMTVTKVTTIIGDSSFYRGKQNKKSRYTKSMEVFDSQDEALGYLKEKAIDDLQRLLDDISIAERVIIELEEFEG